MTHTNNSHRATIFLLCAALLPSLSSSLLQIPTNVISFSKYLHSSRSELECYDVEEFVDINKGNVRLELLDFYERRYNPLATSYFRLHEAKSDNYLEHDAVILYKKDERICTVETMNEWPLRRLTQLIGLFSSREKIFNSISGFIARVSIGPVGLLHFVHTNAKLFRLESKGFNHYNFVENYYFSTELIDLDSENQKEENEKQFIKIVVTLPTRNVSPNSSSTDDEAASKVKVGKTFLSQIDTREHISIIAVFSGSGESQLKLMRNSSSFELMDVNTEEAHDLDRLMVLFDSIQDSSIVGHHLGELSSSSEQLVEANPFTLPIGSGCGLWLPNVEPLFVLARQFSGRFEAFAMSDQFYVAFDEQSGHLRYDSLGEFKSIYSLHEHSVTMITTNNLGSQNAAHEDRDHCAQYSSSAERRGGSALLGSLTIGQLLGLGPQLGLMYLGTATLEDEMLCQVYEREVIYDQIPALVLAHSRPNLKPTNRYFLNFYFDEQPTYSDQSDRFERMILRRLRLISYNDIRHSHMESQLNFEEFSWSLDVGVDASNAQMEHPVRVFDTLECGSQQSQSRVEFALRQVQQSEWKFATDLIKRDQFYLQLDRFELELVHALEQKSRLPRSKINQLEIVLPEEGVDDLLIRFVLGRPLKFEYTSTLLGWILQLDTVTQTVEKLDSNNYPLSTLPPGEIIKLKTSIPLEECALRLSTGLAQGQKTIYMLHCPFVGCGYIRNHKWNEVEYIKRNSSFEGPSLDSYVRMCSVHLLSRQMSAASLVATYYADDKLMENLNFKKVNIALLEAKERSANYSLAQYEAQIRQMVVRSALKHEQWDDELLRGECYTIRTKLEANGNFDIPNFEAKLLDFNKSLKVMQLDFDKHHSLSQCHQACLLSTFCKTYTYNSETHQCTLASLDGNLIAKPQLKLTNSLVNKSCKLFALNQLKRYKQKQVSLAVKASSLIGKRRPILVAGLHTCATLCHRNELNQVGGKQAANKTIGERCLRFIYLRAHSLCHLMSADDMNPWGSIASAKLENEQDPFEYSDHLLEEGDEQFGWIRSLDQLDHYMGKEAARRINHCELFERDYRGLFLIAPNVGLLVREPPDSYTSGDQVALLARKLSQLTLNDCVRECAVNDPDCQALDYHVESVANGRNGAASYEQLCVLYHFRSPYSFGKSQIAVQAQEAKLLMPNNSLGSYDNETLFGGLSLSPIEQKLYLAGLGNYSVSVKESTGWHYYMSGEQLYLKRLEARSAVNEGQLASEASLAAEVDEAGPERGREQSTAGAHLDASVSFIARLLDIALGILLGFLVFGFAKGNDQLDVVHWVRDLKRRFIARAGVGPLGGARPRSLSRVELNEMMDIGQ